MMLGFVSLHKGGENVQFVPGLGARLCIHQVVDTEQRTLIVMFRKDCQSMSGPKIDRTSNA